MKKITLIIAIAFASNVFAQTNSCYTRDEFNVGGNPEQVITADFNGDGKKDLATANNDDNTVTVLLGDGAGNFADVPGITLSAGNCVHGLVSSDFSGDGKADLAVTNGCDNNVSVYIGNGTGGFGAPVTVVAGSNAWGITSGDFNADTKMDLAVTNDGAGNVSILLGNGNGTFQTAVNYSVGGNPRAVTTSDLNGDGKADLAVTNNDDNTVSILLNSGLGTFGPAVNYGTNSSPLTVIVGDFNSDGNKDLVVANSNSCDVSLLQGNGDGTFQSQVSISSNCDPYSVTSGDFNSDGNIDLAVVNNDNNEVSVMTGDGNGNFGSPSAFNVGGNPYSIVSADFNGDGKMDIATSNNDDGDVTVLLNTALPTVVANASATSVCPGSSVILTGSGAGVGGTNIYNIPLSALFNVFNDCGNGGRYGNDPGFTWMSTEPNGTTINSIVISVNVGVDCSGGNHTGFVNSNNTGSVNFGGSYCNCSVRDFIVNYNVSPGIYNVGASNSFYMQGGNFGFSPNSTWLAGIYARVTVTYGADYSWSGGVTDGVAFTPGSTTTYVVAGTTTVGCTNTASVTVTVNPAIVIPSINTTDVTCNSANCDGTADLSSAITGGTSPYAYSWSNGNTTTSMTGLCAGGYTLTVTDAAGCSATSAISIINTSTVSVSPANATTNATCICNGTADMLGAGTGAITYLWSTGATTSAISGLCPGSYTVTATDANGCTAKDVAVVNNMPAYTFSTIKTNAACTGTVSCSGSATITPSVAGTYTFVWSPSGGTSTTGVATGLCAGNYTVTATDGSGCTLQTTVVIGTTPIALSFVNITANCSTSCNGKSTVSASGGSAPYTYAWSSAAGTNATATGLCGGSTYTVTVTDASGCSNSAVTTIASQPLVAITNFNNTGASCTGVCNGSSIASVSGGTGPYTYAWSPTGGTNATATGLCADSIYTLIVSDANGCSTSSTTTITIQNSNPVYIDDFDSEDASCDAVCDGWATVYAFDGAGSLSYAWSPSGGTSATATGLCAQTEYTVTVTDANGCTIWDDITIGEDPMSLNMNINDAACIAACNGAAEVSVSDATGPFTYLWSNGASTSAITGLCSGNTYSLTVTAANGCKATNTFNIIADNDLGLNLVHGWWDRATCLQSCDGVVNSDPFDGYAPYTYAWSNGATTENASGLCSGTTVMLTVTDSVGCTVTETRNVIDRGWGVKIDNINTTDTWCNGVCAGEAIAELNFAQRTPIQYMWSNGGTTFQTTGLCAANYTLTVTDSLGCMDTEDFDIETMSNITFNTNTYTDASCEQVCNGTAKVSNLLNAVSPVTYMWMPSGQTTATATGLCSDVTYSVTVTDANGCTTMNTRYIDYEYDLSAEVSTTSWDASCSGICNGKDSAYVTPVLSTGPYMYQWFPSGGTNAVAANLCAGTYSVIVTDSVGCKGVQSDIIFNGVVANVSIAGTDVYCNSACNGTAIATVSGGAAPYAYAWTTGATTAAIANLCAGTYGLNVTDANGCVSTDSETIFSTSGTLNVSVAKVSPTCNAACDGTASASVNGGVAPYAYQWLPSGGSAATAAALCAGTYTLNVTDANGCTQSSVITLTQPGSLVTNVTITNPTSCVEGEGTATANVAGGTAPYSFSWNPTGQITQTAVVLANGTYSVVVTDAKGCTAAGSGMVSCTNGITELSAENVFSVSPNPTSGNMIVTAITSNTIDAISIDNVLGQTVFTVTNNNNQSTTNVDITSQPTGIYFMRIRSEDMIYSLKVIKQ